jgi:hypothetical protein
MFFLSATQKGQDTEYGSAMLEAISFSMPSYGLNNCKLLPLRSGVENYVIFLTTLYEIILHYVMSIHQ